MTNKEVSYAIEELTRSFRLPAMGRHYKELADDAMSTSMDYKEYLFRLLQMEHDARNENGINNRIKRAHFPHKK